MKSAWSEHDAQAIVDRYAQQGIGPDLALRIYSTRLLGGEPGLVLHGGGNTSIKALTTDLLGEVTEVVCVKASGGDMATIDETRLPALRLDRLHKLRTRDSLPDEDMPLVLRDALIDPRAPNPSVETLMHAFLPHKFIDHTHANAVLSLTDQEDSDLFCVDVYGSRMGIVPYIMPGFSLAVRAAAIYELKPKVEGLILQKHGIVTFGSSARESYERMIEMVSLAEDRLAKNRKAVFVPAPITGPVATLAEIAPILRGIVSVKDERLDGAWRRPILDFRTGPAILNFVNGTELVRYAQAGVVTPDHVIRTKIWPLILAVPEKSRPVEFKRNTQKAVTTFIEYYKSYFARHNVRVGGDKKMVDPQPRVVLVPGLGLFGLGRTSRDAMIAADIATCAIETITDAEAVGRYVSISEAEMFDMEYWAQEQAKLGEAQAAHDKPLTGQVAVITGAAGAIGVATAKAFMEAGAEVALMDLDETATQAKARTIGPAALAVRCDVTNAASVRAAFDQVVAAFGGVDIVVSNAGAAWQGRIGEVDEEVLHKSFELNFYGHQRVAQAAVKIMLAQSTGGCLLFNVSKQAVNPGANFGPYGLPKAATLLLVRQYALEYGSDGIRANAVNADRVRSGLLTDDFIKERSKARGVNEKDYMSGNLLGREVMPEDVAQAFVAQALALKTTADVTTVDGGNIAAALR
jgi:rhamnose utilization protein RhaD (predicted bifunctional aldolase and dehydrogenase)/NAD(P)-dependent dehydrogenase (short-subunit alcohol dehydrogenase family)